MTILVTGGAGYIGSHFVRQATASGLQCVVLDTLEYGHTQALPSSIPLYIGSVGDTSVLTSLFQEHNIDVVVHFAGYISVAESVANPKKYISNNVLAPVALLEAMAVHAITRIIFSSTAAVYGNPVTVPIPEEHPKNPTSPYGLSKWSFEELLRVYDYSHDIRSISLRYFNASGASLDGQFGEAHRPETHIIPLALKAAHSHAPFTLYGSSYPTRDGSCERDYIHIQDLYSAHMVCIDALMNNHKTDIYNVGTGNGVTNKEILKEVSIQTKYDIQLTQEANRPGDPAILVADSSRLQKEFGWHPLHSDISTIVKTALAWHTQHPDGYRPPAGGIPKNYKSQNPNSKQIQETKF